MKTSKRDSVLVWVWFLVIVLVALVLVLISVKPVGAASVCGPLVGPAAVVESALTVANVPHTVLERVRSPISCAGIGCPKPKPVCMGWVIRITATPARWLELVFGKTGVFYEVR